MEERFDYVIVDEQNKWRSTGVDETEEQLEQEIKLLQEQDIEEYNFELKLFVFKTIESYSV